MAQPTWPAGYRQNVTVGGTPANSRITKTGGVTDTFDAVARIQETWTGAGYIECTIDAADKVWFGLTNQTTVAGLLTVTNWVHALQTSGFSSVSFHTNAAYVTEVTQPTGQRNTWRFEVFDSGGGVYKARIHLNGVIAYTFTTALTLPISAGLMIAPSSAYGDAFAISGAGTPNQAPVVTAGADQTIEPGATATLDATVTDDGLPSNSLTYTWSKQSGPGTVTFGNAALVDTTATFSANGVYVLRLTVSDGALTSFDELTITVIPTPTEPVSPLTWDLRTDGAVVRLPTLPAMGPKGSTIIDPDFNTPITRMTDATSATSGISWGTASGLATNEWSADDAYFYAMSEDGSTHKIVAFNSTTGTLVEDHDLAAGVEMTFARPIARRTKMYGCQASNSLLIKEYDVVTRTWSTIYDLTTDVPGASPYQQACYSSHKPKEYIVVAFSGIQETYRYVTIVNPLDTSDRFTIDCNTAQYKAGGGAWTQLLNHDGTNSTINFGLHSTNIDRTGNKVYLGASGPASHMVMFNTVTQRIHEDTNDKWLGHGSFMFDAYVNASAITKGHQWLFTDLTQGGTFSTYRTLINPAQTPGDWSLTDHNNTNNARSDALTPFITETQTVQSGIGDKGATPADVNNWNALWEEIALIATATGKVAGTDAYWRVCHHRMGQVDGNGHYVYTFQDSPRVQINHGGTHAIFTSNWGFALGTYGSAVKTLADGWPSSDVGYPLNHRRDLFLVRLSRSTLPVTPTTTPSVRGTVHRSIVASKDIIKGETQMDVQIYKGAVKSVILTLAPAEDITGWSIAATVRKNLDTPVLKTLTGTLTTPASGVFTIPLTDAGTLTAGTYQWDVWRTNSGSEELLVPPSELKVLPSVTHP